MTILSERSGVASRNASFRDGVIAEVMWSPINLTFALALGIIAVLLLAWVIDGVFVSKVWPQSIDRLRDILAHDLRSGVSLAEQQGFGSSAITGPANYLYSVIFEATGIDSMGRQFADRSALSIPDTIVRRAYVAHREAVEVMMVGTQLLGVRSAALARFAPILILFYASGSVDGLVQRAIRRARGGRESASLYHRAKYLQIAVLGLGSLGILLWPDPVEYHLAGGLISVVMATLARGQWAYYKKHL